jgi:predicted nuclease with RNAse H fold
MMQQEPATAKVAPMNDSQKRRQPDAFVGLTRAEAHALRRSAPLTPAQFRQLRLLAEQGVSPLRHL